MDLLIPTEEEEDITTTTTTTSTTGTIPNAAGVTIGNSTNISNSDSSSSNNNNRTCHPSTIHQQASSNHPNGTHVLDIDHGSLVPQQQQQQHHVNFLMSPETVDAHAVAKVILTDDASTPHATFLGNTNSTVPVPTYFATAAEELPLHHQRQTKDAHHPSNASLHESNPLESDTLQSPHEQFQLQAQDSPIMTAAAATTTATTTAVTTATTTAVTPSLDPTSILSSNLSADVVSTAAAAAAAYGSLLPSDAEDIVQTQQIAQMNNMIHEGQHHGGAAEDSMTSGGSFVCDQGTSISGSDGDGGESREQHLATRRLKDRERYASMSEEQREEYNHKRREQYHRQSEESRKRRRERERLRYHSLPPDKAKERNVRRATLERERYKRLSAEELAARNAKRRARAAAMRAQKRATQQQQQQPHPGGGSGGSGGGTGQSVPVAAAAVPSSSSLAAVEAKLDVHPVDDLAGQLHPSMMGMVLPLAGMEGGTSDLECTAASVNLSNSTLFQQHGTEENDIGEQH